MYIIYIHTNTESNKSYIGLTKTTLEKRWKQHLVKAFTMNSNYHFHNAIRLYGADSWKHGILHSEIETLEEACVLEIQYIKGLNTFEAGYNSTIGGEGTKGLSGELSPHYGKPKSEYVKQCIRERMKSFRQTPQAMAKRVKTRRDNLPKYEFIHSIHGRVLASSVDMYEQFHIHHAQINSVIQGKCLQAKGWQLYTSPDMDLIEQEIPKVFMFTHDEFGLYVGTSIEFAKAFSLDSGNISAIVRGKHKTHKGWKFLGEST